MRHLYLVVVECPPELDGGLEEFETDLLTAWTAAAMPYQLRAIRRGGILALKVLEELPPVRRGERDRIHVDEERLTRESEHRAGEHSGEPEPGCPLCAEQVKRDAEAVKGLDISDTAGVTVEGVLPLD